MNGWQINARKEKRVKKQRKLGTKRKWRKRKKAN